MKDWNNFYTPKKVAEKIINLIPEEYNPNTIIDICVGSGNFLDAALNRWNAEAIGVDINKSDYVNKHKSKIYIKDALNICNLQNLRIKKQKLILANPPFGKFDGEITSVCEKHSLLQKFALKSKRIETNMIVSNMSLLEEGEIFAAILPENIFSSEKLHNFKEVFLSYFNILTLGEPEKYFSRSEVLTRIFIGCYTSNKSYVNGLTDKITFPKNNFKIFRGIDNSKIIKNINNDEDYLEVIHFGKKHGDGILKNRISKNLKIKYILIGKDDILISRVGRNTGQVYDGAFYQGKLFSDYFFLVKNLPIHFSSEKRKLLEISLLNNLRGLTTRYLSKNDIVEALNKCINGEN